MKLEPEAEPTAALRRGGTSQYGRSLEVAHSCSRSRSDEAVSKKVTDGLPVATYDATVAGEDDVWPGRGAAAYAESPGGAPAAGTTRVRCGKTKDEDSGSAGTRTGGLRVARGRRMPTATIETIQ